MCSSGGSFTAALQGYHVSRGQYAITSAALASMGYGLATAIGVAFARPGQRIILAEGDGGFAQSLQELAIIRRYNLPIKIFLMDNGGCGSIRATQKKFCHSSQAPGSSGNNEEPNLNASARRAYFNSSLTEIICFEILPTELNQDRIFARIGSYEIIEVIIIMSLG